MALGSLTVGGAAIKKYESAFQDRMACGWDYCRSAHCARIAVPELAGDKV
jgi:hypothetical protein